MSESPIPGPPPAAASPFPLDPAACPWSDRGQWPAQWIACAEAGSPPFVSAYRCRLVVTRRARVTVFVTADERYDLFLDGVRLGCGPERGDAANWFYETYTLALAPGRHVLVARVWALGRLAPWAQVSLQPGFLLAAPDPAWQARLGTGSARWEARKLPGYDFLPFPPGFGVGPGFAIDGAAFAWDFAGGRGRAWAPAQVLRAAFDAQFASCYSPRNHLLRPGRLPPMLAAPRPAGRLRQLDDGAPDPVCAANHLAGEAAAWQALLAGQGRLRLPPHTQRRAIVELDDYCCAYPELCTSGGAGSSVQVLWAESLFTSLVTRQKPPRGEVEGQYFAGIGDRFAPDGGRRRLFEPLWWRAGRYLEIRVQTGAQALTLDSLTLRETRYPLAPAGRFRASDPELGGLFPILVRSLQMCAHETYMDCPHYEQLMYIGDTRLQVLANFCLTTDDRLTRKALRLLAASRQPGGLTKSNHPGAGTQLIPPFSLWWVCLLRDYAWWRDDAALVSELLPVARGIVDTFLARRDGAGLVLAPPGWNFVDWVPDWTWGEPPGANDGPSAVLNWQAILALQALAELETVAGEAVLAMRARRLAAALVKATRAAFWDSVRRLFADDLARTRFSEHAQSLAILAGRPECGPALLREAGLTKPSIYFTHYLFDACRVLGRADVIQARLGLWRELPGAGFKTTYENGTPASTRSDCHAWAAHPLYHYFASFLGIRPAAPGFARVRIAPQLGTLRWAEGRLPHPRGEIAVRLRREGKGLAATVSLPEGVTGELVWGRSHLALRPGRQSLRVE